MFSSFPGGGPGVGLLLLRAAVGLTAAVQGVLWLLDSSGPDLETWIGLTAVLSGASLLSGFMTPISGALVGVGTVGVALSRFLPGTPQVTDIDPTIVLLVPLSVAIVLLGPGGFSIDARLFGRRQILIPDAPPLPKR